MPGSTRFVEARDLPELTRIYNHYVTETPITFDVKPFTVEERRPWLESFSPDGPYRCFVIETGGSVRGWASSGRFRPKTAYDSSVELTIYLDPEATGERLGTQLYEMLLESLADTGLHRVLGGVTVPNPASIALHRRFGFRSIGVFHEVGFKLGRYWDVEWFELDL